MLPAALCGLQGYMVRYQQSLAREAVEKYAELARQHGLTPTQLALAWCRSRWNVASTVSRGGSGGVVVCCVAWYVPLEGA